MLPDFDWPSILIVIAFVWVFRCLVILLCMALIRPSETSFNGFRIHIDTRIVKLLSNNELAAIVLHELGHKRLYHVWSNYFQTCFFIKVSKAKRIEQELQADNFVAEHGMSIELSKALRKLSYHPFDLQRADRMEHYRR